MEIVRDMLLLTTASQTKLKLTELRCAIPGWQAPVSSVRSRSRPRLSTPLLLPAEFSNKTQN